MNDPGNDPVFVIPDFDLLSSETSHETDGESVGSMLLTAT